MEEIQKCFRSLGWLMTERAVRTLDGGTLWLVRGKRDKQTFSAQGTMRADAWESAWRLAEELHLVDGEDSGELQLQVIVPFPQPNCKVVA